MFQETEEGENEIPLSDNNNHSNFTSIKQLNLNGLCKKREDTEERSTKTTTYVDEIVLPQDSIQSLSDLQVLSLRSNGIQNFPVSVLQLTSLVSLDLAANKLLTLPPEINQLKQ